MDDGQRICADAYIRGNSGMVRDGHDPAADLVGLSFLLGAPIVACALSLQACACAASPQREHRPVVGNLDASRRARPLSVVAVRVLAAIAIAIAVAVVVVAVAVVVVVVVVVVVAGVVVVVVAVVAVVVCCCCCSCCCCW